MPDLLSRLFSSNKSQPKLNQEITLNFAGFIQDPDSNTLAPYTVNKVLVFKDELPEGVVNSIKHCLEELLPFFYLYNFDYLLSSKILVTDYNLSPINHQPLYNVLYSTSQDSLILDLQKPDVQIWKIFSDPKHFSSSELVPYLFGVQQKQLKFQ